MIKAMMKNKVQLVLFIVAGMIAMGMFIVTVFVFFGRWGLYLYLEGKASEDVAYMAEYTDPGAVAHYGSAKNKWLSWKELEITTKGEIDTSVLGKQTIEYTAVYKKHKDTVVRTVIVRDVTAPVIELYEEEDHFTRPVDKYEEEGYKATDDHDGDITERVKRSDPGDGYIYYEVSDISGNRATAKREIKYFDSIPPEITLEGDTLLKLAPGEEFKEPGFKASDDCDGDITDIVIVSEKPAKDGNGKVISYIVSDSYDNMAAAERLILDKDVTPPVITLAGDELVKINAGTAYTEQGATASDDIDGDISGNIVISGKVDIYRAGDYTITYKVSDAEGNVATAVRQVNVVAVPQPLPSGKEAPKDKVVYLTFDDGPGRYTQKLLDILDKYNVKATFFVTNQFPNFQGMIAKEAAAGHTVAIHTYSHVWKDVYTSEEGYFKDLNKMNDIIEAQTGKRSNILRFPGGSSNKVSLFTPGIMTRLTKAVTDMGYVYYDWNVSSGDAGGTTVTSVVVSNVINGIKNHKISVVLQHDIKGYSVDAVEQIITWGLANGYTFLPLEPDSAVVHSRINN
ncbi:MAG: polysaccharide deacetylase family protein [Lachnospiraceae bacterium]|nr:polysaccharide deacetylase family protein [Lachnospiraceae bacterium]